MRLCSWRPFAVAIMTAMTVAAGSALDGARSPELSGPAKADRASVRDASLASGAQGSAHNPFTLAVIPASGSGTGSNSDSPNPATLTVTRGSTVSVLVSIVRNETTCTFEQPGGSATACTGVITLSQTGPPAAWNACFPVLIPSDQPACIPEVPSDGSSLVFEVPNDFPPGVHQFFVKATAIDGPSPRTQTVRLDVTVSNPSLNQPPFSVTVNPGRVGTVPGGTARALARVDREPGFTAPVQLAVLDLPHGVTASVRDVARVNVLLLTADETAPIGVHRATVKATSGTQSRTANVELAITQFALSVSPPRLQLSSGDNVTATVTVHRANGFAKPVHLRLSRPPAGMTGTVAPNPATSSTSTLALQASSAFRVGTHTLAVHGFSEGTSHTATVTLAVVSRPR